MCLQSESLVSPYALCRQDLEFIVKMVEKGAVERLEQVANTPFVRLSYTDAIADLEKAVAKGKKFEYPVSAHESVASAADVCGRLDRQPLSCNLNPGCVMLCLAHCSHPSCFKA